MEKLPRLDILLYAHDGRGLGHVSRTIAIGLALRRLYPNLRVLFLSGSGITQELIGSAPLDWLKLPSYATVIKNGRSKGADGKSNFSDGELGTLRSEQIKQIVATYRPRIVLVDHSPQGKHKELLPALQARDKEDTQWILGVRGIVGEVKQLGSGLASSIFQQFYSALFWYGDSRVLGEEQLRELKTRFASSPVECGYVSGIRERLASMQRPAKKDVFATVSIPWFGEKTPVFLRRLHRAIKKTDSLNKPWHLFLDHSHEQSAELTSLFAKLPCCHVEPPGKRYLASLLRSQSACIYGGYNSLMDVLALNLPALVLLRDMQDNEQQDHLTKLAQTWPEGLQILQEDCREEKLVRALAGLSRAIRPPEQAINMNGAEYAASYLFSRLNK